MEKPVLVIIGETHPSGVETDLISNGSLWVTEAWGRRTTDTKTDGGITKELMRSLTNIVIEEAKILRENGVSRLFVERPALRQYVTAYKRFRRYHNLAALKSGLRKVMAAEHTADCKTALDIVSYHCKVDSLFVRIKGSFDPNVTPAMFAFSAEDAAY